MTFRGLLRAGTGVLFILALMPAVAEVCAQDALPETGGEEDAPILRGHAIAMHGQPKYGPEARHPDYVNPDAPGGGQLVLAAMGGFDSFNPFIPRGEAATGLGLIFDTLMRQTSDEPFSEYGLVAREIIWPRDRSGVTFKLRPEARFHDGHPITAEDVVFSFDTLVAHGGPYYRFYYGNVDTVTAPDDHTVVFRFKPGDNLELPLILGQLIVLPKHWWAERDFSTPGLEVPLGSGPYRIADFEPGRHIAYERVDDYWGRDLFINRGQYNFGAIRYEYYRDRTVMFEAFKSGEYDLRPEYTAKNWAVRYDFPAVRDGRIRQDAIDHSRNQGMQAWTMNARRKVFSNRLTRRAMAYFFDFDWADGAIQYGAYERTLSYFSNSEMAASGLPAGEELDILSRFRDRLAPELFTRPYSLPRFDAPGKQRENLRAAIDLLRRAGWELRDGRMVDAKSGTPFTFEILLVQPTFEDYALSFRYLLRRAGIEARIRTVDTPQYINRLRTFDFDMIVYSWAQSESPGNEQRYFWGSGVRDQPGGRNMAGIDDPVIDELIELVIGATTRESLVQRVRALDRALLWGHYVVPQWYKGRDTVAYWDMFARPDAEQGFLVNTWWIDEARARALGRGGY